MRPFRFRLDGQLAALNRLGDYLIFRFWFGSYLENGADNAGLRPHVELLHEARFLLFGHLFVSFGKRECFGSGQLVGCVLLEVHQGIHGITLTVAARLATPSWVRISDCSPAGIPDGTNTLT